MIKNVITTLGEERQMHTRKVRINLEFLEILLVNVEPSCPFVYKDLGVLKEEGNIFLYYTWKIRKIQNLVFLSA